MTWRPTQPNGWRPQVSVTADQRIFVTYGNAQCWLAELRRRGGGLELVRETLIDGARAWGGFWISSNRFVFWKEDPDVRNGWHIYVATVLADGTASVARRNVPIELAGGNAHYAGPGDHWMAIRTGPGRVVVDGQIVHQGGGGAGAFAWPWFAHAADVNHNTLRVVEAGSQARLFPTRAALHVASIGTNGKVLYGGYGDVRVLDPIAGSDERATVTPWRYETPNQVLHFGGWDWLVSVTYDPGEDGQGWVLIRPEGESTRAITHRVPVTDVHVAILDDQFVVAAANRGDLRVDLVPIETTMQALPVRVPSPGRAAWAGAYYDAGRDGDLTPIGNCTVLSLDNFSVSQVIPPDAPARQRAAARAAGAIFIGTSDADLDAMRGDWGLVAGLVCGEHPTFTEIEQEAAQALQRMAARGLPRRPIVATLMPNQPWAVDWRKPKGVDKLAVEFYLDAPAGDWHEQQRLARRRFDQVFDQVSQAKLPIIMVAQAYDRAKQWPNAETREALMPVYADVLAEQPIEGIWFFAHGRGGGMRDHPELKRWAEAIARSCPRPPIETLPNQGGGGGNTGGNNGGSMARPAITITEPQFPDEGIRIPAGGSLRCVWAKEAGSGRIDEIHWLLDGVAVARNHPDDPDHTFRGMTAGKHEIGARAIGPGGDHQTGRRRLVIVEGVQTNPDPLPQPGGGMKNVTTLKSLINGRVVCVDRDRPAPRSGHAIEGGGVQVLANRDAAGPWEEIQVVYLPGDQVAFRGRVNDDTLALFCGDTTIEPRSPVLANRADREVEAIGGYEAFTPERVTASDGSAAWAIKGHNGKYWRVDPKDPAGRIFLDGEGAGPYEMFSSSVPLIASSPHVGGGGGSAAIGYVAPAGRVRMEGWAMADDNGPRPMLSVTMMDAETQLDQDRPRLAANVDYIVANGGDFARILTEVDWEGKEANPRRVEQTIETVRFMWERGLRTELTIFGSHSRIDRPVKMDWVRVLSRALRDANLVEALALIEFINEGGGARVGADECHEGLRIAHEFLPSVPKATTAPYDRDASTTTGFGEQSTEYRTFMGGVASIATPHLDRGVNPQEGEYRICRQPWNALMMGYPFGSNEPAGPWASAQGANVMLDPNMQRVHCNGTWMQGGAFHCWHVDQGVGMRTDAPLWEAPGLPGLSAVRAFIPRDITNFKPKNWHWGDNPFKSLRGVRDGNPKAPVRIHGLVSGDGRVVGHVLGCDFGAEIEARSAMRLTLGSWDGDEYAPVHEFEVRAGQQFFAPAAPDQIFVGRFI